MTQIDLMAMDATEQADKVRSRAISAQRLVEATLARITDIEPLVNAFRVVTASSALAEANRIDSLPDAELAALPLAGVPVAIKDDTDVAGRSTMWGSVVDRGVCGSDADVVSRLRGAGAVIIGKTNVPELTPLCESPAPRLDRCPTRGAMRSLRASNTSAWLVPWNLTGQPATGIDDDNLPTAIQLAGQARDETRLLTLAAQIKAAQPFPRWVKTSPTGSST